MNIGQGNKNKYNQQGDLNVDPAENFITFANDYSGIEASTEMIPSPGEGKRIHINSVYVDSGANSGVVTIQCAGPVLHFKKYLNVMGPGNSGILHRNVAEDSNLNITCPANTFVIVVYKVEDVE